MVIIALIIKPSKIVCSAALSAPFLFFSPINREMTEVTPIPNPNMSPIAKNIKGILKDNAAIAEPFSSILPTKNISTRL